MVYGAGIMVVSTPVDRFGPCQFVPEKKSFWSLILVGDETVLVLKYLKDERTFFGGTKRPKFVT